MAGYNGSGVFSRLYNWVTDKGNSVAVTASRMDGEMDGFATGLSTAICKDGQTTTTARIPFASGVSAAGGSVSAAPYCQTNDANTGLYFPATDEVALTAGGTKALHATATGVDFPLGVVPTKNTVKLDAFATGTAIVFRQTAAPTGWTKDSTHNDKALRIVSGTVGSGGTVSFSTCFSRTTTENITLLTANLPPYTPAGTNSKPTITVSAGGSPLLLTGSGFAPNVGGANSYAAITASLDNAPVFTGTAQGGTSTAFTGGMDIRVQYADCICATKDA